MVSGGREGDERIGGTAIRWFPRHFVHVRSSAAKRDGLGRGVAAWVDLTRWGADSRPLWDEPARDDWSVCASGVASGTCAAGAGAGERKEPARRGRAPVDG